MVLLTISIVVGIALVIGMILGFKSLFFEKNPTVKTNFIRKKQESANVNLYRPVFLMIGLTVSLGFTYAALELANNRLLPYLEEKSDLNLFEEELEEIPITEIPPPPPPKIVEPVFEEVPDEKEIKEPEIIIPEDTIVEPEPVIDVEVFAETEEVQEEVVDNKIWNWGDISQQPSFPGGMGMFYKFIRENYNYPERDKVEGNEGTVYLNFVIEKDGTVASVKVLRGVNSRMDAEALRIIKQSPNWIPGKVGDQHVRVSFMVPLKLTISD